MDDLVRLGDGRAVGVAEHGDPDGDVVFVLHGTPASRLGFELTDRPARERRVRVVCPDRPGVGRSDPMPGRWQVVDYADDLAGLADGLGVDQFAVVGYSGGAPFALAVAARLEDRVRAAVLLAGAGQLDRPGGRGQISAADRLLLELSERGPWAAGAVLEVAKRAALVAPRAVVRAFAADLPDPDRRALLRDGRGKAMVASYVEALRQGPRGVIDDYRVPAQPWGFRLADVRARVDVWHGDVDRIVSITTAEDIAAELPDAVLHRLQGEGHISILDRFDAVLDRLATPS